MSDFDRLQKTMEEEKKKFNELVKEIGKWQEGRQKLSEQHSECSLVKSEIDRLEEDAVVYKLTGPILVNQSVEESKCNVNKRLQMIAEEITRSEIQQKKKEEELEKQREKMKRLEDIYIQTVQTLQQKMAA
jgi:prefoldin beta subunit